MLEDNEQNTLQTGGSIISDKNEHKANRFDLSAFNKAKLFKSKFVMFLLAAIIFFTVLGVVFLVISNMSKLGKKKKIDAGIQNNTRIVSLKTAGEAIDADSLWRNKLEENLESQGKNVNSQIDSIKELISDATKNQQTKHESELKSLEEKLRFLEEEFKESKNPKNDLKIDNLESASAPKKIRRYKLSLSNPLNSENYEPLRTSENYIPAGTVAKGILLHGVDVSTSLKASGDPDPITIEITDYGNLPNRFRSDLKNCRIRASIYGDLSNERGKARIEKLSCTEKKTGVSIETEVAGYLTDETGKVGIKGVVVSKDYKLIQNSFMGGILSGLAKTGSDSSEYVNSFTIGLGKAQTPSNESRLKNNLLSGAGTSLDRIADYYIDRAEAIQPVIEINAAREVNIFFSEGAFIGNTTLKKQISKKRDQAIKDIADKESDHFVQHLN